MAPTLGTLIDKLNDVREEKRLLAVKEKELEAAYKTLELQVMERLQAEGMDKATGKKASVSLTPVVVAAVQDWDALCKYVKKTGYFQLFQRRVSDPAFRELIELKKSVPGLEAFTKINVNLRSI